MLAPVGVLCMELAAPATGACGARAVMVTRRRHSDAGEGMGWEGNRLRAQKAARVLKKGVNVFWDLALTAARRLRAAERPLRPDHVQLLDLR